MLAWLFFGLLVAAAGLLWVFYDRLPWVGTHFVYVHKSEPGRWSLNLTIRQARALGNRASLEDVPAPTNLAHLAATIWQQPQVTGQEVTHSLRIESVESVQYSWEQKETKDLLTTQWEARTGLLGGLHGLQMRPEGRALWLRNEVVTPWLLTLWPQFLSRGVQPKQSWSSLVPFKIAPRELNVPLTARWDCTWTYRSESSDANVPIATLDLAGQARCDQQPVDGTLRAEVAYSVIDRTIVAVRGVYQLRFAAATQATEQSSVAVLECVQGKFEIVRLVPGAKPAAEKTDGP